MKKKLLALFYANRGFTMIELLIVVTILGILAVAVLSAINPIEQIDRGRDTSSRSDAEQALNAIERFYAFQGYYPWMTGPNDENYYLDFTKVDDNWRVGKCEVLGRLGGGDEEAGCAGSEELKASFLQRITDTDYNPLYVYNAGDRGDSTYVCFTPKSKAFSTEAQDRCDEKTGGVPEDFPDAACSGGGGSELPGGNVDYMICLP